MFGLGMVELLLIAAALAVAVALSTWAGRSVSVDLSWSSPLAPMTLERRLLATLIKISGGRAASAGPGRLVLIERWTPAWAIVMAIFTFPLGLLFLLFKTERTLTVMIESEPGGSRVDLVGATRSRTLASLDDALVAEHGADARSVVSRL
jgi:hypothetical protein